MSLQLTELDQRGVRWARGEFPHPGWLTAPMVALSRSTDHSDGWLLLGLGGALLDRRRRRAWLRAGATISLVELSARGIKRLLPRDRPQLEGLPALAPTPSPMSFPSSHTAAAFAAVDAFTGLVPRRSLELVALVSAFSRLYLGVHFPSDVVAGAGLGLALGKASG
jgi:membrane-associated phospholipid phosphatase